MVMLNSVVVVVRRWSRIKLATPMIKKMELFSAAAAPLLGIIVYSKNLFFETGYYAFSMRMNLFFFVWCCARQNIDKSERKREIKYFIRLYNFSKA